MTEVELIRSALEDIAVYVSAQYETRHSLAINAKTETNDLVTEVDLEAQRRITERIHEAFPGDEVIAEELGMARALEDGEGRCWLIDPIDGTQNFVRGLFPAFGVSLAYSEGNQVQAAGIAMPMTGQLYLAERGSGAVCNDHRITVSKVTNLEEARSEIDFGGRAIREETLQRFGPILTRTGQFRCHCAAVVGLCSVATGDADAYFHVHLNPWDYAAATLIVEEAGGHVTRMFGQPVRLNDADQSIIATNGAIHEECLAIVGQTADGTRAD